MRVFCTAQSNASNTSPRDLCPPAYRRLFFENPEEQLSLWLDARKHTILANGPLIVITQLREMGHRIVFKDTCSTKISASELRDALADTRQLVLEPITIDDIKATEQLASGQEVDRDYADALRLITVLRGAGFNNEQLLAAHTTYDAIHETIAADSVEESVRWYFSDGAKAIARFLAHQRLGSIKKRVIDDVRGRKQLGAKDTKINVSRVNEDLLVESIAKVLPSPEPGQTIAITDPCLEAARSLIEGSRKGERIRDAFATNGLIARISEKRIKGKLTSTFSFTKMIFP